MKLLSKQRDGKKVRRVYDAARTPLQRLLQSCVLPAQKQQELTEVAQALDPIRLFQQGEQLQQAVFRCAFGCTPFVSTLPSTPIRVFSVERCTAGKLPVEESVHDPVAGLHILNREQERRKRVLGWRSTHKDPYAGEWEQIMSWLVANPERSSGDMFREVQRLSPGRSQPLHIRTDASRDAQDTDLPARNLGGAVAGRSDPWPITRASLASREHNQDFLIAS
jgi:hypothetical protein